MELATFRDQIERSAIYLERIITHEYMSPQAEAEIALVIDCLDGLIDYKVAEMRKKLPFGPIEK